MMKLKPRRRKSLVSRRKKKSRFEVSDMNLDALYIHRCFCCGAKYGYKERYKKVKRLFRRESAYISR